MRTPKDAGDPQSAFSFTVFWHIGFVMPVKARLGILLALLKRGHWPSGMGDGGGRGLVRGASIIRIGLRVWGIINWNRTCYYRGKGRILGFGMRGVGRLRV